MCTTDCRARVVEIRIYAYQANEKLALTPSFHDATGTSFLFLSSISQASHGQRAIGPLHVLHFSLAQFPASDSSAFFGPYRFALRTHQY